MDKEISNQQNSVCVHVLMVLVLLVFPLHQVFLKGLCLLFITYINNVAAVISPNSDVNMFADDIALYRVI